VLISISEKPLLGVALSERAGRIWGHPTVADWKATLRTRPSGCSLDACTSAT